MSTITRTPGPPADATDDSEDGLRSRALYRAVWRWHFYAGLFAIPVIVLLCLSGIVYLFKPQIYGLMYGELQTVAPAERTVSYQQQRDVVEQAYPGATVTAILTPSQPSRSTQFDLTSAEGKALSVFVNPYSGEVLGHRDNAKDIVKISLALHGSLMTASWLGDETYGDRFIEIVAGWSIVLLVTGVYLWWPRGQRRGLRGVLLPRFHLRGKRMLWRDIHAVTGILFSFVTMFFLVTGMAWTGWWGPKYLTAASDRFEVGSNGVYDGASSKTVGEKLPNGQSPWALGNLPLAASDTSHRGHATGGELRWDPRDGAPLDAVVASAQQLGVPHGFTVTPPEDATGSYMIAYWEDGDMEPNRSATDMRVAYIDQYTAQPLADYDFGDLGPVAQATNFGIALHEGRQWGLVNQLMTLAGALAILISVASAMVMWRKRRPKGLGSPRKESNRKLGFSVVVIMIALGALFPLLGLSMLAILALEFLVIRRVPRLARIFGTATADQSRT
ncbi:MAG: PepSY domain-containing protein [Actinomycetota bacterium]|nr:PepSY domain-containing protein [Actinomycetota bacterium]